MAAPAVAAGNPDAVYVASARGGVLRSRDGGATWEPASRGLEARPVLALATDPGDPAAVHAGADGGLFRSDDGGATWRKLPYPGSNAVAVAVSPARATRVLAVAVEGQRGLVHRSDDGGTTWHAG